MQLIFCTVEVKCRARRAKVDRQTSIPLFWVIKKRSFGS